MEITIFFRRLNFRTYSNDDDNDDDDHDGREEDAMVSRARNHINRLADQSERNIVKGKVKEPVRIGSAQTVLWFGKIELWYHLKDLSKIQDEELRRLEDDWRTTFPRITARVCKLPQDRCPVEIINVAYINHNRYIIYLIRTLDLRGEESGMLMVGYLGYTAIHEILALDRRSPQYEDMKRAQLKQYIEITFKINSPQIIVL
ncbi:hypothetical protein F5Y11DRAFT_344920 [Daldinia sp. FL1419]|nr:hypothetical protein F5Y11DRAFT_344920 [Daldinia sp. FL1419]